MRTMRSQSAPLPRHACDRGPACARRSGMPRRGITGAIAGLVADMCLRADGAGKGPAEMGSGSTRSRKGGDRPGFSVGTADVKSHFDGSAYNIDLQARLTGLAGGASVSGARRGERARNRLGGAGDAPCLRGEFNASSQASRTVRMGLNNGTVGGCRDRAAAEGPCSIAIPVQAAHKKRCGRSRERFSDAGDDPRQIPPIHAIASAPFLGGGSSTVRRVSTSF